MSDFQTFWEQVAEQKIAAAELIAAEAKQESEAAKAALAKVMSDVQWCMKHGLIADVIFQSNQIPAAQPGYTEIPQPTDSELVAWLNQHARVSCGERCFCIAFEHGGNTEAEIPTPYNIRDIINVARVVRGEIGKVTP